MWSGDRASGEALQYLGEIGRLFRRWRLPLAAWTVACLGATFAYTVAVRPEYVATASVMLVPSHIANDGPEDERHYHQFALDSQQAETELSAIRSEVLLRRVFDALNLAGSPELASAQNGLWSTVAHELHRFAPNAWPYDERNRAFFAFTDRVRALRLGLSYVISISYRSQDPVRAARVVNAVASAYVADRLQVAQARLDRQAPYRTARVNALNEQTDKTQQALSAGTVPDDDQPSSDVRLLGPATPPLTKAYPKFAQTMAFSLGFALISGSLAVVVLGGASVRRARLARRRIALA